MRRQTRWDTRDSANNSSEVGVERTGKMPLCPGEQKVIEGREGTLLGSVSDRSGGPEGRKTASDGAQFCAQTPAGTYRVVHGGMEDRYAT